MDLLLRLAVFAGLGVDAYVHIHMAGDVGHDGTISMSTLFWVQGIVAGLVAILILLRPRPVEYLIAFLVAASALGAVLVYRYFDIGAIGPFPQMYEPVWYTEKVVTTVAEAVATVAALVGLLYSVRRTSQAGAKHGGRPIRA